MTTKKTKKTDKRRSPDSKLVLFVTGGAAFLEIEDNGRKLAIRLLESDVPILIKALGYLV